MLGHYRMLKAHRYTGETRYVRNMTAGEYTFNGRTVLEGMGRLYYTQLTISITLRLCAIFTEWPSWSS